jgi:Flp pilus assembly protein TadB
MPRKRRRTRETPRSQPQPPEWQWRTFPVFFAFAVGLLVGVLGLAYVGLPIFWLAVFAVVFGLTHMITRRFVQRRQRAESRDLPGRGVPTGKGPS